MALDFTKYNAPGVYTDPVPGPQVTTSVGAPNSIGIFGDTLRYRSDIETVVIPADNGPNPVSTQSLRQGGIDPDSVMVVNSSTGQEYVKDTDYQLIDVIGEDATPFSADDTYQIKRITSGDITPGQQIQVSYNYTDTTFFNVFNFYDYDDVRAHYGPPYDEAGNIVSELTLAAKFAFQNGASVLTCVAVQHSGSDAPSTQEYLNAMAKLEDEPGIAIVVPATGSLPVLQGLISHVRSQSQERHERRAIVGRDGTQSPVNSAARIASSQSFNERRIAHLSPDTVNFFNPDLNKLVTVGSQFLAAAVAAVSIAQNSGVPLTRKTILGFDSFNEQMSETTKDAEAQAGLMVIEKTNRNLIRVRHGLTTNVSSLATKEWSFTGQEDAQSFRIRDYLDNEGLIGSVITDLTLVNVKASASAALQSLVDDGTIRQYANLKVRQLTATPDVIEIRYDYLANVPLNYIVARYTVNVSDGSTLATNDTTTTV